MKPLITFLALALLVLLTDGAPASPNVPSKELEKIYRQICDYENGIPDVDNLHISDYQKSILVDNYLQQNINRHLDLAHRFRELTPNQDSRDPGVLREKERVIAALHQADGASFETIAALSSTLRGPAQFKAMAKYVRDHPKFLLTRLAAYELRPQRAGDPPQPAPGSGMVRGKIPIDGGGSRP